MAERQTEITINVYAGVPFDNKYNDVLFVSRETLASYLSQYEIGTSVTANRFEIIDDTQAIVDLTNDFQCMNANYVKVHRKIMPETNNDTYEYDTYYFVSRARQIATNVIRLYLEIDVFQTQFNKYDYQTASAEIPQIKKSIVNVSTDFNPDEKMQLDINNNFNNAYTVSQLWARQSNTCNVRAIIHFTNDYGEFTMLSAHTFSIFNRSANAFPYDLSTLMNSIKTKQKFYIFGNPTDIEVLNVYLIPEQLLTNFDTTNLNVGFYRYTLAGVENIDVNYYIAQDNLLGNLETKFNYNYVSINAEQGYKTTVGTFTHQIDLEYNKKAYIFGVRIVMSNILQVFMLCNNEIVDVTQDFEFSILKSDYAEFINAHKNGLAIKGISNALNLLGGVGGLLAGNPASALTLSQTITGISGQYAEYSDLKNKPLKLQVDSNNCWNIYNLNGFGMFKWQASNYNEIIKNSKFFGNAMRYLTDKTFVYLEQPIGTIQYNFDYYQFANVNVIGKIPQTFKSQIEQMFLNGIRIWYNKDKFLTTIENRETVS